MEKFISWLMISSPVIYLGLVPFVGWIGAFAGCMFLALGVSIVCGGISLVRN